MTIPQKMWITLWGNKTQGIYLIEIIEKNA